MRKHIFLLYLFIFCTTLSQAEKNKRPVPVIFDSDMGYDYDDVGALAMLHALADNGEAEILATIASTKYQGVAAVFDILNTYYNRPNLSVGVPKGKALSLKDSQGWSDVLISNYPHSIRTNDEAESAIELYRKTLAAQPNNSVTIITVGFLTNIAALLKSPPDAISPLTGMELVHKKVFRMVSMAGAFPSGVEFNIEEDIQAAQFVFENWEKPLLFSGFELGNEIKTGLPLVEKQTIKNNPVKDVYKISIPMSDMDSEGRMSWDQTAVLAAVRGEKPYFSHRSGRILVRDDGSNIWHAEGHHQYLVANKSTAEMERIIDELMMKQPSRKKKPLIVFVLGDHEYSGEETIPVMAEELEKNYDIRVKVLTAYPNQNAEENIPGLNALEEADLAFFFLRWRRLPKEQLKYIMNYLESGKPVMGMRTSTHAFNYPEGHQLEKWNAFGELALNSPPGWEKKGHTHYGHESTTDVSIIKEVAKHPILTGVKSSFSAKSWLYTVLPDFPLEGSESLLMGTPINPDDPKATDHPVAWIGTNSYGARLFMTTLGHPEDFREVSFQRLLINAVHWLLGKQVPKNLKAELDIDVPYRGIED